MKKIRIAICDRDPENARVYEDLCRNLGERHGVPVELKTYQTGGDLLLLLDNVELQKKLDVIFYVLFEDEKNTPELIRKTGYAGLLVFLGDAGVKLSCEQLFDAGVFNVVRKGRTKKDMERFSKVFQNAVKAAQKNKSERMALTYASEIRQIDIDEIQYFEVVEHSLTVYYGENQSFTFISSLAKMEEQLKGKRFMRTSRFFLVSLDAVQELTVAYALMRNGKKVSVGRSYQNELKIAVENGGLR